MTKIKVMVNGLPGKMASKVVEHITRHDDLELLSYSFTGPEIEQSTFDKCGYKFELIKPEHKIEVVPQLLSLPTFISVDYTHPSAVNTNAEFYCKNGL